MGTRPKLSCTLTMAALLTMGCAVHSSPSTSNGSPPSPEDGPALGPNQPAAEREKLTAAECEAKGGSLVGDIGDGAIHREDYRCENGQAPIATITAEPGAPVAIEGSVCCPGDL